jgi:general secretion pathway protein G
MQFVKLKLNRTGGPPALHKARGFSLVEILIVVVILGILAAIAVPKLTNASQTARQNTLKDDVRFLRTQIAVYMSQHKDIYPGYPAGDASATPTADTFVNQMTMYTDDFGNTSATQSALYRHGIYLQRMPENPINGLTTILIVDPGSLPAPDGSTGWIYQPSTGIISPNLAGNDSEGKAFSQY